jgi:hypothetical protein
MWSMAIMFAGIASAAIACAAMHFSGERKLAAALAYAAAR